MFATQGKKIPDEKEKNIDTYELNTVLKSLFSQIPIAIDRSNEAHSHVEFNFNEKIDPLIFNRNFGEKLGKLDYVLKDNAFIIAKEGMCRFKNIIKNHFKLLEMQLNHKKYESVLPHVLNNQIKSITQITYDTAIIIRFNDKINEEKFNNHFMMDKSNYDISDKELTIFSEGICEFNHAVDFSYVDITQKLLTKQMEKTFSLKMF